VSEDVSVDAGAIIGRLQAELAQALTRAIVAEQRAESAEAKLAAKTKTP
jgi:hypothetical protein